MKLKKIKKILFTLFFASGFIFAQSELDTLNVGISSGVFDNVNHRDVQATLEVWGDLLTKDYPNVKEFNVNIYNTDKELLQANNTNAFDLVYMSALKYVELEDKLNIKPLIATNHFTESFYNLILCGTEETKSIKFADLKNSSIVIQGGKYHKISELWLDVLCLRNGIKNKENYFKSIEISKKPMQAVLSVYMKKANFCIVNSVSLSTIADLNPQIAKGIKPIFKEEKIVNDLICLHNHNSENKKKFITELVDSYNTLPKNKQLFKVFKSSGSTNYKHEILDGMRKLVREYNSQK